MIFESVDKTIFKYICSNCGKKRQTVIKSRVLGGGLYEV